MVEAIFGAWLTVYTKYTVAYWIVMGIGIVDATRKLKELFRRN